MSPKASLHESLSENTKVEIGSEKSFGIVFAVVFTGIGLFPIAQGKAPVTWLLALGVIFLLVAFACPRVLRPLNLIWFKFGLLLHKIVNPIVMGVLFFITIVPMGILMRLLGKDLLNKRFDPNAKTYWIARDPVGPLPETMRKQF